MWRLEACEIGEASLFRNTRHITSQRVVSSDQAFDNRHEFITHVCLVSTAEGKKLVNELKGDHALAILVPMNVTGAGEEVHVLVEDPSG